ncbi:unnamed protein product, partial [Prorocentrum cordatum]
ALGAIVAAGGAMGPEVCLCVNGTLGSARPMEKHILRKTPSTKAKMTCAHALPTSSHTYSRHVWNGLNKKNRDHIAAKYAGPYRVAASLPMANGPVKHPAAGEVIAKTRVLDFGARQHLPRDRWPSKDLQDSDIAAWTRLGPKHFTNAAKAATAAYLPHMRDQAQLERFQKDIQMPATPSSTAETVQTDGVDETKYIRYVYGRTATTQGMNLSAIAASTAANKKSGRRATFSEIYAAIQPTKHQPAAPKTPEPAERWEVIFIADRPRQPGDLQHIVATCTVASESGMVYCTMDTNNECEAPTSDRDLQLIRDRIQKGETAAIYAEMPRRTWYCSDQAEDPASRASARRSKVTPRGPADVAEKVVDELCPASSVTREVLTILHAVSGAKVPVIVIHAEDSIFWALRKSHRAIKRAAATPSTARHCMLGIMMITANSATPIQETQLKETAAENFDFAAAALLDDTIIARWGFRVASEAPTSDMRASYDRYLSCSHKEAIASGDNISNDHNDDHQSCSHHGRDCETLCREYDQSAQAAIADAAEL